MIHPPAKVWSPPKIPCRQPGWERGYIDVLAKIQAAPFGYGAGEYDCLRAPSDLCKAMTGVDPMQGLRNYRTEKRAFNKLFKLGFNNVEEALSAVFSRIDQARARRGDCGVLAQATPQGPLLSTLIIIHGHMALGKGPGGAVLVPVSRLQSVFAIGAP